MEWSIVRGMCCECHRDGLIGWRSLRKMRPPVFQGRQFEPEIIVLYV